MTDHAELMRLLRMRAAINGVTDGNLMREAADALADSVPRESYNLVGKDCRNAEDQRDEVRAERDDLAHVIEQVRRWKMARQTGAGGSYAALTHILDAAPAVSLARHDTEVKAQALEEEASRWDKMNGMSWCSMVGRSLHQQAAAIRAEAAEEGTITA